MKGSEKVFHINMLEYTECVNVAINQSVSHTPCVQCDTSFHSILSPDFEPDVQYRDKDRQADKTIKTNFASVGVVADSSTGDSGILPTLGSREETWEDVTVCDNLSTHQKKEVRNILKQFKDVLTDKPGITSNVEPHKVTLTHDQPIRVKPYPLSFAKKAVIKEELDKLLALGVIEPSTSPYSSPVVLVSKSDNSIRFCVIIVI